MFCSIFLKKFSKSALVCSQLGICANLKIKLMMSQFKEKKHGTDIVMTAIIS